VYNAYGGPEVAVDARISIPNKEIRDFCRRYHIRSLALFGSVLRADFRTDSDVDLLVEFEPGAHVGLMLLSRMQRELADLLDPPIDLVPRDGLKPSIRESVLTTAQVIYAV
jgi:predicted nucleotidyltransferase